MQAQFLFLKRFGSLCTGRRYSQHYLLDFPIFWVFTSTYWYELLMDKYTTLYVSLSYFA